jgi:DNA-binding transcriptional MerR regulator
MLVTGHDRKGVFKKMNIREVAERTGLSAHTIRFYEKNGLLPKIRRSEGGIRQFTESDVVFLQFGLGT